jgi:hypothetical protein
MKDDEWLSREEQVAYTIDERFRQEYKIVDSPIVAVDLCAGMVLRLGGKLRVVVSVRFENPESGPVAVVETACKVLRFASDSELHVWYMNQKPFIMELPPDKIGTGKPRTGNSGSAPLAQDAAGIVPVWMEPKRIN